MFLLFDIDNVIRDWTHSVNKVLNRAGYDMKFPHEFDTYSMMGWFNDPLPEEEINDLVFNKLAEEIYVDAQPIPGARQAINNLYYDGHTIVLVSNQFQSNIQVYTDAWLEDNHIQKSGVVYTDNKQWINGHLFIDDYPMNLINHPAQYKFLFHRPWNKNENCWLYFENWNEISTWVTLRDRSLL